nr:glycine dehydrogenase (decarboxylating) A, mitochondrial [Tanacetum cinerariifolium]
MIMVDSSLSLLYGWLCRRESSMLGGIKLPAFLANMAAICTDASALAEEAYKNNMNLRIMDINMITVSFDETTTIEDVDTLFKVFSLGKPVTFTTSSLAPEVHDVIPSGIFPHEARATQIYQ